MTDPARVRVAHQPARHVYVDHLTPPGTTPTSVELDVWDVDALRAAGVDIVHLHFGFEHVTACALRDWCTRLEAASIGLVHTVHDIDNPHLVDQGPHHARLAVLMRRTAAVITLTPWAADRIADRFGRRATVIEHPHVIPLDELERRAAAPTTERDGLFVHGATIRPNLDLDLVERWTALAASWGGLRLHVRSVAVDAGGVEVGERLRRIQRCSGAQVDVGPRLTDDELWDRLASARGVLLPYRWGTHSGLLEAAHDVGTPVVAPAVGGYSDQGASTYGDGHRAVDPDTCVAPRRDRRRQRTAAAADHAAVYRKVLERLP